MTQKDDIRYVEKNLGNAFQRYAPKLLNFLTFRLKNKADAQDLTQETYVRLMRVKRKDLIRHPDAYLFKIADNLANEFLIKQNKSPLSIDLDTAIERGKDSDSNAGVRATEAHLAVQQLEKALNNISPLYKSVLLLRKRDGLSHKEIAKQLEISPNTVHVYLTRALLYCRAELTE
ncbi:MAG: RNA polymerase sigma factor [Emcibacter sp.]|nr:RNA polymerase sigma factor [Emcibacter sp.]